MRIQEKLITENLKRYEAAHYVPQTGPYLMILQFYICIHVIIRRYKHTNTEAGTDYSVFLEQRWVDILFFIKVVEASDVILEVLDARDPLGCRCPQVEQAVIQSGTNKKIVLMLNKIGKYIFW